VNENHVPDGNDATTPNTAHVAPGVFRSLLFRGSNAAEPELGQTEPECFHDLNLDQVVAAITHDLGEYDLTPFFRTPLTDLETIHYRHRIFRDLEDETVHGHLTAFAAALTQMRAQWKQATEMRDAWQRRFWMLRAHHTYQDAIVAFADHLTHDDLASDGLRDFREHLTGYAGSDAFGELVRRRTAVERALDAVRYCVQINGNKVTVTPFDDQPDYGAEVEETFAKFRQGDVRSHLVKYNEYLEMNHVEASVLALVAQSNPDAFGALQSYTDEHSAFIDRGVARFDREAHFYLGYRAYVRRLQEHDLPVCYPTVSDTKQVHATESFDIALAHKLIDDGKRIVTNDFALSGDERIIVVTGANQGGKTTFSRAFGQLHYLAALGCPVPGRDAELFLADHIFTHFEKEEDIHSLSGKLEDELVRIHDILGRATGASIVIMNEIFTSTSLDDAILLGTAVLRQLIERDTICVCVTFVDELSTLSDTTVSMVATVEEADAASRTYRVVPRPADGLAHAVAIAEKYGLTFERLTERIGS